MSDLNLSRYLLNSLLDALITLSHVRLAVRIRMSKTMEPISEQLRRISRRNQPLTFKALLSLSLSLFPMGVATRLFIRTTYKGFAKITEPPILPFLLLFRCMDFTKGHYGDT